MAETKHNMYPKLVLKNIEHPSKLLAFPFLGILIRLILIIPVVVAGLFYTLWYFILWLVVPFAILFTGKYPDTIYTFFLGYMRFYTKVSLYLFGLTDTYPGFGLDTKNLFELDFEKPTSPSRLLSSPILGTIIRLVMIIPYAIFESVMMYGAQWAVIFSWFAVLFKGKYPESLYEFNRDYLRVAIAETIYTSYLSDTYPSFSISMKHKKVKILLLVLGAIGTINALVGNATQEKPTYDNYNNYQDAPLNLPES